MTDKEIVSRWLLIPANIDKLPTIAYPKAIFDFIVSTMDCSTIGDGYEPVYKVNGDWQKIICK